MAMTEITFDGSQFPQVKRFTLDSSTANKAHQVNLPNSAKTASVRFEGAAGKLSFDTSSDSISSDYIVCAADTTNEFSCTDGIGVAKGVDAFFVASASTSTVVSVIVEG